MNRGDVLSEYMDRPDCLSAMADEIVRLRRTVCVLYREVLHDSEVGDISFVEEVFAAANENGREDPLDIDVVQGVVNMVERLP
jgi:hypothetical protein